VSSIAVLSLVHCAKKRFWREYEDKVPPASRPASAPSLGWRGLSEEDYMVRTINGLAQSVTLLAEPISRREF
jgi:hypothetical protein